MHFSIFSVAIFVSFINDLEGVTAPTGYSVTEDKACTGQNDQILSGISLDECVDACNGLDACLSFEYYPNHEPESISLCQPSTTCTLDQTVTQTAYGKVYLYEKLADVFVADGYSATEDKACTEQNDQILWDISFHDCVAACNGLDGCLSFEYYPNHEPESISLCQPSTTCTLDQTVTQTAYGKVYLYEKLANGFVADGYSVTEDKACTGQNDQILSDMSLDECVIACNDLNACLSFEYYPNHEPELTSLCQPSTTCTLAQTVTQTAYGKVYLFEKLADDFVADGYSVTEDKACTEQNDQIIWDISLNECVAACNDFDGCLSFEYYPNHEPELTSLCQPSTTCTLDQTVTQTAYGKVYLYEKLADGFVAETLDGYSVTEDKACTEQNDQILWDISFHDCVAACNGLDGCLSFEYYPNHEPELTTLCQPSTTCILDQTVTQTAYGKVYLYEKLCDDCTTSTYAPSESTPMNSSTSPTTKNPTESTTKNLIINVSESAPADSGSEPPEATGSGNTLQFVNFITFFVFILAILSI